MRAARRPLALLVALAALATAPAAASALTVYGASSLKGVIPALAPANAYSWGGSDTLMLQIEQGAPADVFLSAAPIYATRLHDAGRCSAPIEFARNALAFVVPAANPGRIANVRDLAAHGGYRLAIGRRTVPIGIHARTALGKMGMPRVLLRNTVSSYAKASDIVTALTLGNVDGGFVYATDYYAHADALRRLPIPRAAQPLIRYVACAVRPSAAASALIRRLQRPDARAALVAARFTLPPRSQP